MAAPLALVILVAFLTFLLFNFLPGQTSTPRRTTGAEAWKKKAETIAYFKDYTKEGAPGEFTSTCKFGFCHLC